MGTCPAGQHHPVIGPALMDGMPDVNMNACVKNMDLAGLGYADSLSDNATGVVDDSFFSSSQYLVSSVAAK